MRALLPFLTLFKTQWLMMLLGGLLTLITLLAGIGLLSLSGWFLSATAVAGLSIVTAQAFNFFTPAGGVRFLSIARTASRYGERLATHEATFRLLTRLRVWVWQKIMPLAAADLEPIRGGDLLNRLVADIDTLDHLYLRLLTPLGASLLTIICLYCLLAYFDSVLALTLCSALIAIWLVLPLVFYQLGKTPGTHLIVSKANYRVRLIEFLQGQAELALFGALSRYRKALDKAELDFIAAQQRMLIVTAANQAMLVLLTGGLLLMILYLAGQGIGASASPGPLYALMVFATMSCSEMLMPLAGAFQHLSSCELAAKRLQSVTSQTPSIVFSNPNEFTIKTGEIHINNVTFGYQSNSAVLKNLNLHVASGSKVALLGATGCGKSSLLSLITRQWQYQQGNICLDKQEINLLSEYELRRGMSVLSQRVYIFSASLRDNLAIASMPNFNGEVNTIDDQQLIKVLRKVGLESLLESKAPLDAWLGQGGRQLSGGEIRRIGVARILLRDAPLLLLDEPTEGLDKRTEREILSLLFEFARDKTLLMICHRLCGMAQMDQIHMMDNGQIVESGTHESLLAESSRYQGLFRQINLTH